MEITRTSNAGVLLKLDGVSILLDGVCNELYPYSGTPADIRNKLVSNFPDVLAFTHKHKDHYDEDYAKLYNKMTLRPVLGPELSSVYKSANVEIKPLFTRHIGKYDIPHVSFAVTGSNCTVLFTGDASPLVWKKLSVFPSPDVVIAPYAYASTVSSWQITEKFGSKAVILLHFPQKENDEYNLRLAVDEITNDKDFVYIPEIGENIIF